MGDTAENNILKEAVQLFPGLQNLDLKVTRKKEGLQLTLDHGKVTLTYEKPRDLCRGLYLAALHEKESVSIREQCPFSSFGVMIDLARNGAMRVSAIKEMIRLCAFLGYSFIGLYFEDVLEVKDEPYFGYLRGAYSKEELIEIRDYAALFGMEVRPYVETLAHVNQCFRWARYEKSRDIDDILLVEDAGTRELLDHLLSTIADIFPGSLVNIGMDEAAHVGRGRYLDTHPYTDRKTLLSRHLALVLSLCRKYGLRAQLWSDMFVSGTDEKDKRDESIPVPEDAQLICWDYYSADETHYEERLKQHLALTKNVGFAGGAFKWTGFAPRNGYSIRNGKAALEACKALGIPDVVITLWGDDGDEASAFSVLPVLYEDAAAAFGEEIEEVQKDRGFQFLTGYPLSSFLLLDAVNLEGESDIGNGSKILLYNDPLLGVYDSIVAEDLAGRYRDLAKALSSCRTGGKFDPLFTTLSLLSLVLSVKADLGVRLRKAYQDRNSLALALIGSELPDLEERIRAFYQALKTQWLLENKPFGFEVQTIRLGGLLQRIRDVDDLLQDYLAGKTCRIEELEEKLLPYGGQPGEGFTIRNLEENRWYVIATPARLDS